MPRHYASNDYEDDPEGPDEGEMDAEEDEGDASVDTVECPRCGRSVYETVERCPKCGTDLSRVRRARTNRPMWVIFTALLLLAAIALGWLGGVF